MKRVTLAVVLLGGFAAAAVAQEPGDAPDQGVARLSLIGGDVTVQRGDSGELIAGERNAPLVALDHVLTGPGSRAEIQFDWANMIRLDSQSDVRMAVLEDRNYVIQMTAGAASFRVLRDSSALVEISTPAVSVRPLEQGTYRLLVGADGATEVTVRSGRAEIVTTGGSEVLQSGRTIRVRSDSPDADHLVFAAIPWDDWDRWNESRDRDLERSGSYQYVSRDIYGADDLDDHGRWVYDPPYGWVWAPDVPSTWAPYRVGRWTWVNYYGWTWVSGDPWGWAPYHYGRWYYGPRFGWAWHPGARGPRHYWRPALVGFFGWGSGGVTINAGFSFGNVGWVPLAPHEVYRPWYGRNNVTVRNVTVINNTNIIHVYRNARFVNGHNGVTSVTVRDFGRNRVTLRNFVHVTDRELHRAGDVRGRTPFEPPRGRAALLSERSRDVRIQPRTNRLADFVSRPPERRREQPNPVINRRSAPQGSGPVQADTNRDAFIRRNPGSERRNAPGDSGLGQPRVGPAGRNDRLASAAPRTNPPRQQSEVRRRPRGRSGEQPDSMAGPRGPRAPRVNGSVNGPVNGGRPNSNGDTSSDAQPGRGRGRR